MFFLIHSALRAGSKQTFSIWLIGDGLMNETIKNESRRPLEYRLQQRAPALPSV